MTKLSESGAGVLHRVIISVGSNIEAAKNIARCHEILAAETILLASAKVIQTSPVGYQFQPDFLNTAYLIETPLEKLSFNRYLKAVEERMGRLKGPIKSGPRAIDLDIVIWDDLILTDDFYCHDYVRLPVQELLDTCSMVVRRS
ncbi:2-amino-4-hydroxy-6-hydroxymethyldihydropteridine diphosphokinase [Porticoccus sp.]|uniref:2-amino-4-hydroxy-6- hydroxymethyldihydropteridine diphosphokinase n=1 Tax=Porticoccus sp. TaxID=2024853 RepID=UPI003F6997C0